MPRNARLAALLSFTFHGILILAGRYRLSYDAYNHMFFGDHYRMDWWSLWEPRWYTGFFITSYPPLIHQLIGALSHIIGLDAAFASLLWLAVTLLPLAVYSFARIFIGRAGSGYAALGAAFLPSVYLTAHIFGQLPTLAATVTALFGMAALDQYLRAGNRLNGVLAVALLSTVMAFHHATLLLLPWLVMAIAFHLLLTQQINWRTLVTRLLIFGLFATLVMLIVIWPFWIWGRTQSIQTPIDHASRHNFFKDPRALMLFFVPMYGPLLFIIPAALFLARKRQLIGPGLAFLMLFLLGLGDTTPLPRLLFGKGWEWLTYDRFAFWASLTLLPFFGMIVILLRRQRRRGIRKIIFLPLAATALLVGLTTAFLPLQPGAVDMRQVVDFLQQRDHSGWRYVTFGFGDQLALLSTLTTSTTIDGSYHTARTLPELRTSGIGQIDTAFWLPHGLSALDPILQKSGEHGVRWGFVNVSKYIPVLQRNGWTKIETLKGGVQVWENPEAILPTRTQVPPVNTLASFSWGTLPVLSLVTSLSLGSLRAWPVQAERVLRGIYAFTVGLVPMGLCFWYYRTISEFPHASVYFTYTNALFFLGDGLALLAVILWLAVKVKNGFPLSSFFFLPLTFCLLTLLSILWSRDWHISLYISLHILLIFLFILSLRDWSHAWRSVLPGFCAALSIQFITGLVEFIRQSTAFLAPLHLKWPGMLDPFVPGAVIVQLPGGEAFLRAYGTLPHPNILGGFTLVLLLGPIAFFLRKERPNPLALLLLIPGVALLALTFSRSAWLALIVFSAVLVWKSKYFDRKRLPLLLAIAALTFGMTLLPYRQLVAARTTNTTSHSEAFSFIGRAWLNGGALQMIREVPLTGVGIGSFIIELSRRAGPGYVIEPAHNLFLLAGAELGIPGLLLVLLLSISLAYRLFREQNPNAILAGAALTGLAVIGLFDHYLWTLAPGRLMLGLVIGLFVGQGISHEA
ncbi:MAG TPA: O-antigen ligase family protein [Anaerolineales bacterium]|nr:O-antigen ligase family protein [Anaerolineales bacterium]